MARRGHAKKIETVHWTGIAANAGALAADANQGILTLAAQHLPETLMRIRGEWSCTFDGVQATAARVQVAVGLCLVPEGTGTTVLWSPIDDPDAPWIWYDTTHLQYEEYVTDVIASDVTASMRRVIDNKAMRRVRNMELQFVAGNFNVEGSEAVNVLMAGRVLSGS